MEAEATAEPEKPNGENLDTLKERARLSEIKLAAMLTVAIAQDQRATTLTGVYGAASVALFGASAGPLWEKYHQLAFAGIAVALFFFAASMVASRAARSAPFFTVGVKFSKFATYDALPVATLLRDHAEINTDPAIDDNQKELEGTGRLINRAIFIASIAPLIGFLTFAALSFCRWFPTVCAALNF